MNGEVGGEMEASGEASAPHLQPAYEAIARFDPFGAGGPLSRWVAEEPARAALAGALRRTLAAVVERALGAGAENVEALSVSDRARRALAYLRAVSAYVGAMAPHHPVSPAVVAGNGLLAPRLRGGRGARGPGAPLRDLPGALLRDLSGAAYADPLAVVFAEAAPAEVDGVSEPEAPASFISPLAFAAKHCAEFCWAPASFPVAAARLADGTLLIPQDPAAWRWARVGAAAIPPEPGISVALGPRRPAAPGRTPAPSAPSAPSAAERGEGPRTPSRGTASSALLGAQGEARVYELLRGTPHAVRGVAHRARSADMVVETARGRRIYVEVKNYASAVPEKEARKFRRDLGARGADAGVLVSLSSKIVGVAGTLVPALEPIPGAGRVVPVVYVASGLADVVKASVDIAAYLAQAHSGTLPAGRLHPRDSLEAHAADCADMADQLESARAQLGALSSAFSSKCGGVLGELSDLLRGLRGKTRALRLETEVVVEAAAAEPQALWRLFADRFRFAAAAAPLLRKVLRALAARDTLGALDAAARWRFLKNKATHLPSRAVLSFGPRTVRLCRPCEMLPLGLMSSLLARHPAHVKVADGAFGLDLREETAEGAVSLAEA
jgi:hypothetical protein